MAKAEEAKSVREMLRWERRHSSCSAVAARIQRQTWSWMREQLKQNESPYPRRSA